MKRNDTHSPSKINPSEYEWVAYELIPIGRYGGDIMNDCDYLQTERQRIREHMVVTGGQYSQHEHGGNCMVCGNNNCIYTVLFYHNLTNTYVRMGQDCAQKCEMSTGGDFNAFATAMKAALELKAGKRKAEAVLAEMGMSAAWNLYNADYSIAFGYEENTIRDIVGKLVVYGNLSVGQKEFLPKLLVKIDQRESLKAQREADKAEAATVEQGRQFITGTILALRHEESQYGPVVKMFLKSNTGFTVWGTLPKALAKAQKGDVVKFSAEVSVSEKDSKHGFFSRPTKAEFVSQKGDGSDKQTGSPVSTTSSSTSPSKGGVCDECDERTSYLVECGDSSGFSGYCCRRCANQPAYNRSFA